ncbi:hypothetical protein QR680_011449 [Steinernema hermaphroditum]|uniref:Uncharacterized protein n=1 Tax=Steinernema hermaphroditum TaxID=289476 RepID=A0AA39I048_9BILA|nr:hypothetical protein QR680_011449 [Steinernema hermaphroditum]
MSCEMVTRIVIFVALLSVLVSSIDYCDIRQFDGYSVFFTSCKKIAGQPFEIVDFNNFATMEDLEKKVQTAEEPATASNEPIPTAVANSSSLPLSTTKEAQPENSTTTSAVHAETTFNVTMTEEAGTTSKEPAQATMANATSSSVLETQMTTAMSREELTTTLAAPTEVTPNVTATEELSTVTMEGEPTLSVKKNSMAAPLSTPEMTSEVEPKSSTTTSMASAKIATDTATTEQPVTTANNDIGQAVKHAGDRYYLIIVNDFDASHYALYQYVDNASKLSANYGCNLFIVNDFDASHYALYQYVDNAPKLSAKCDAACYRCHHHRAAGDYCEKTCDAVDDRNET